MVTMVLMVNGNLDKKTQGNHINENQWFSVPWLPWFSRTFSYHGYLVPFVTMVLPYLSLPRFFNSEVTIELVLQCYCTYILKSKS